MIGIINYGSGNVRAIGNIYDSSKVEYKIVNTPAELDNSVTKLILPGVGAFDQTMSTLLDSGFKDIIENLVLGDKLPVLGICVGMQILSDGSDEGNLAGLGWIKGRVRKFDTNLLIEKPKLPHLGWNSIEIKKASSILDSIDTNRGFYFIHSYYFECLNHEDILSSTFYGKEFTSAVNNGNIFGTQFHPEKSHSNGIRLLLNYANL